VSPDTDRETSMMKLIRSAALLVITGLAIAAITLLWESPMAFLVYLLMGGLFLLGGTVVFLLGLMRAP
jgi:hypothetical protein